MVEDQKSSSEIGVNQKALICNQKNREILDKVSNIITGSTSEQGGLDLSSLLKETNKVLLAILIDVCFRNIFFLPNINICQI